LLAWFNFFTDFKLYGPLAIIYFSQVTGSYALGTSIFSAVMISAALFEVPTGVFSDLIGRKKTLALGAFSMAIAIIFYALGFSYLMLVLGAVMEGISRSFYSGNNEALLHDTLKEAGSEKNYHHFLGKLTSFLHVALAISALLGGIIAQFNFALVFWISLMPQIICFVLSLQIIEPKIHAKNESGNIYKHLRESIILFFKNPRLRLLSLSSIFGYGFGEASYQFRGAFFVSIWPLWAIGIAGMLSQLGATVGFYFSGKIIDKFGAFKSLLWGSVYNRLADFVSLIFVSPLSPVVMSTTSLHYGVSNVARSSLMQKEFTDHQRATMGSLNSFAGSIFFAITAFSLGLMADRLNPSQALILLEIFMLVNVYVYWKLFKS
ncbi:MFS transporter, partial [Candidatus Daviesbacteria bacterium]|nr:MFS transporter [Candidatus Daviesbacteria bacterium]